MPLHDHLLICHKNTITPSAKAELINIPLARYNSTHQLCTCDCIPTAGMQDARCFMAQYCWCLSMCWQCQTCIQVHSLLQTAQHGVKHTLAGRIQAPVVACQLQSTPGGNACRTRCQSESPAASPHSFGSTPAEECPSVACTPCQLACHHLLGWCLQPCNERQPLLQLQNL